MQHDDSRMRWWVGISLLFSLVFWQCDGERWWGYRFEPVPLTEQILIQGTVSDRFSEAPIPGATVQFGDQETVTNTRGEYQLTFYLTPDYQRNKPVTIRVTAENYLPVEEQTTLDPIDQQQDFVLEYAAPMLRDAVRHVFENGIAVFQVKIQDYQDDVQTVQLTVTYTAGDQRITHQVPMHWVTRMDADTHIYQAEIAARVSQDFVSYTIGPEFSITALDALGYQARQSFFQRLDSNPPLFIPYQPDAGTLSSNPF